MKYLQPPGSLAKTDADKILNDENHLQPSGGLAKTDADKISSAHETSAVFRKLISNEYRQNGPIRKFVCSRKK